MGTELIIDGSGVTGTLVLSHTAGQQGWRR